MSETSLKDRIPTTSSAPLRRRGGAFANPHHSATRRLAVFAAPFTVAWTAVFRGLAYTGISIVVLMVFALAIHHTLPPTVLFLPFLVLPLALLLLGVTWCLAALGAFTRDIAYLMISIVPLLMFATPVFYRMSDIPDEFRRLEYLNPIASVIEMARNVLIDGVMPSGWLYLAFVAAALVICRRGRGVFQRCNGNMLCV